MLPGQVRPLGGRASALPFGSRLTTCRPHILAVAFCLAAAGCIGPRQPQRHATGHAPARRFQRSRYWLDLPAVASVSDPDYGPLGCRPPAARACSFSIDRVDYRDGTMTTKPLVSKQFFEVWKGDVVDGHDLLQSSLGTMRRIIHFQISHGEDGGYIQPKVIVECYSAAERRITSVTQYLNIFSYEHGLVGEQTDEGQLVPTEYWYSVGRDPHLEKHLADLMRGYLQ